MQRRDFVAGLALMGSLSAARGAEGDASALIDRFAAALNAHDIAAFADLLAPDYVNHQMSAAAPAPSGKSAKQATVDFFANRLGAMPDLKVSVEAALASADMAAASFVYEGAQDGAYYGFPPSGRHLRFSSCDIFRIRDGRIAEHWGMGDIAGVVAQLKR